MPDAAFWAAPGEQAGRGEATPAHFFISASEGSSICTFIATLPSMVLPSGDDSGSTAGWHVSVLLRGGNKAAKGAGTGVRTWCMHKPKEAPCSPAAIRPPNPCGQLT